MPCGFGNSAERVVLPSPGNVRCIVGFSGELRRNEPKSDPKAAAALKRLMEGYTQVQLATLVDHAPQGPEWVHEIKFDGYRLLGFVAGRMSCLRTRNGHDWTYR